MIKHDSLLLQLKNCKAPCPLTSSFDNLFSQIALSTARQELPSMPIHALPCNFHPYSTGIGNPHCHMSPQGTCCAFPVCCVSLIHFKTFKEKHSGSHFWTQQSFLTRHCIKAALLSATQNTQPYTFAFPKQKVMVALRRPYKMQSTSCGLTLDQRDIYRLAVASSNAKQTYTPTSCTPSPWSKRCISVCSRQVCLVARNVMTRSQRHGSTVLHSALDSNFIHAVQKHTFQQANSSSQLAW